MDTLEPNMYVRTKWGYICKLININDFREPSMKYGVEANYLKDIMFIGDDDILKASHNIIDLIESGDILEINNGKYEVIYDESYEKLGILIPSRKELSIRHIALEYVFKKYNVSIVTKEQFSQMAYKIGD